MKKNILTLISISLLTIHSFSFTNAKQKPNQFRQLAKVGLHLISVIGGTYVSAYGLSTLITLVKIEYSCDQFKKDIKKQEPWLNENDIESIIRIFRKKSLETITISLATVIVPIPLIMHGISGLQEEIRNLMDKE